MDSIRPKLAKAKNDSARIEVYFRYTNVENISSVDVDSLYERINYYVKNGPTLIKAQALLRLGTIDEHRNNEKKAVELFLDAAKLFEEAKNNWWLCKVYFRLGYLNSELKNNKVSINYFHRSLSCSRMANDSSNITSIYINLSRIYKDLENSDSALFYNFKALEISQMKKDKNSMAKILNSIGLAYKLKKDYELAIEYLKKAIVVSKEIKNQTLQAGACINIANCLRRLKREKEALVYAQEGTAMAYAAGDGQFYRNGINAQAELYFKLADYKMASVFYRLWREVNDSLETKLIDKNLQELQQKYESDKKDHDLKAKEDSLKLAAAKDSEKNLMIMFSMVALVLVIIAAVFIFRSYRQSKRNAIELSTKNHVIEEKNKEITDSINYARNIQHSLLTSETIFKENLKEHFILFLPKDIVSGDFYWAKKLDDGFMVVCADCTGHGVPGAFMSLLGISYLNEIITNTKFQRPDLVLNDLRKRLIESFSLNGNKDGMDASLICVKDKKLEMAAANNPVWLIRNKQSTVIRPDKFPIGKHYGDIKDFSLNSIELQKDDLVIMFTDGYADQFGGPKNKKFKYKQLEELIVKNSDLPLNELKAILERELKEWKGNREQIDDVLVLGIRI